MSWLRFLCASGYRAYDPRVFGWRRGVEHRSATHGQPRAVQLHAVSQWGHDIHARGRPRRSVSTMMTSGMRDVFFINAVSVAATETPAAVRFLYSASVCVCVCVLHRLWRGNHIRVRRQRSCVLQVFGAPSLHNHRKWHWLHSHYFTQGRLHD